MSTLNQIKAVVTIHHVVKGGNPYLQFDFEGDLKAEIASKALLEWKSKMPSNGSKINLIYNCLKMTGFETVARRDWQTTMKELKNQIGEIWVISDNLFILTAARTMGLVSGFNIKAARSLEQIVKN